MRAFFNLKFGGKQREMVLIYNFFAVTDTMMFIMFDDNENTEIAKLILKEDDKVWAITGIPDSELAAQIAQCLEKFFSEVGYTFRFK